MSDEAFTPTSIFMLSKEDCNDLATLISFGLGQMDQFGSDTIGVREWTGRLEALKRRLQSGAPTHTAEDVAQWFDGGAAA